MTIFSADHTGSSPANGTLRELVSPEHLKTAISSANYSGILSRIVSGGNFRELSAPPKLRLSANQPNIRKTSANYELTGFANKGGTNYWHSTVGEAYQFWPP